MLALASLPWVCLAAPRDAAGTAEAVTTNRGVVGTAEAATTDQGAASQESGLSDTEQKPGFWQKPGLSAGEASAPYPTAPPRADLIAVSAPDVDGYATVTGAAGAVPARSRVALVNLEARNLAVASADAAGAFSARLFAPPGTSLLVKYDPGGEAVDQLWQQAASGPGDGDWSYMNPLPGATIPVGVQPWGGGNAQSFQAVGGFAQWSVHGWAGWWITGTLSVPSAGAGPGLPIRRGQQARLQARIRVTSPALNGSVPPAFNPNYDVHVLRLFDQDGHATHLNTWFNSLLFTPTGLPIEREGSGDGQGLHGGTLSNWRLISAHTLEATLDVSFTIPNELIDSTYQMRFWLGQGGLPLAPASRYVVVWYCPDAAMLPLLRVGSPAAPRIPWVLLADYPVDGGRGAVAREDAGQYALVPRTKYPAHCPILPRLDERSGQPIAYRLEPGSNWLSSTDRRFACSPALPLALPSGGLTVRVTRPDGRTDVLGPAPMLQSSVRTPTTRGGAPLDSGTGHIGDLYHLYTGDERFAYRFPLYGHYVITVEGEVRDVHGNTFAISGTYDLDVARVLDLDPGQLPTTPYLAGDAFMPGLHVFPPVPADVEIQLVQMPNSNPAQAQRRTVTGRANRFGYFQPAVGTNVRMASAGEFRVDYSASYTAPDGTLWVGVMTWGNVIEGPRPQIEAHGKRGMDYHEDRIDDMPAWFEVFSLPANKLGIEVYYPYFSGDVHWGNEDRAPGDSIHSIITVKDLTASRQVINNQLRAAYPRATSSFRWPPSDTSLSGLNKRLDVGEAPLFITTSSGKDPASRPESIDQWGYWYASSERPDVHVRELISEDNMGTAYWRFDDTYGYQIGEPADGDHAGDLKWEFGGAVLRVPSRGLYEYAIYSSLWVLLPRGDGQGARVTPPFQDATGASINGGPILTLRGQDVDMLFLPKGVRPGDVLEVGDVIAFSGHVGPPLDSRVAVTITAPSGVVHARTWHANKIGWLYDPSFDFVAEQPGRWTVDVAVLHDRPYVGNGVTPRSHNTGTVLGTSGRYEFYVVPRGGARLPILAPGAGFLAWSTGMPGAHDRVQPITIRGVAPAGTTAVRFTIHDKGVVMGQGSVTPNASGAFAVTYDARALNAQFSMLSLTAHEGLWEGLADEVAINLLATGGAEVRGNTVTLIGEEVFVGSDARPWLWLPVMVRR